MKKIDSYKLYFILAVICIVIVVVLRALYHFFSRSEIYSTSIVIGLIEGFMLAPTIIFLLLARKSKK